MPRSLNTSALMKPLVVLALPGMYLFYKYNQYKRQQQEQDRRKVTERELAHLNHKIDKLLCKLEENEPEMATSQEDECVICVNARATMQTYPCGHRVVCRKCFVKTIQMAVSQRLLPLRCVICRSKILRLKQSSSGRSGSGVSTSGTILMPTSASQYSMMSPGGSHGNQWAVPNSASLFSMTSGSSSFSGMSSVSSATTSSQGSGKSLLSSNSGSIKSGPGKLGYRQPTGALKKSQAQAMKLRVQEIKEPRISSAGTSGASTSQGTTAKERSASPLGINGKRGLGSQVNAPASAPPRLPPIKEFQRDYRASKERASRDKATSASTRIRCAQKIVTQLEATPPIASCALPHSSKKAVASSSTSYFRSLSPVKMCKKEKRKEEKKRLKEEKKRAAEAAEAAAAAASSAREKEKEKKADAKSKKDDGNESGKGKKKEEKQGKKDKEKKEGKKD
ncbi:axoneme-associated protein mst101(1) [Hetaerina americana]|uniref:axoneme-associated protein mst101(1) n=1 Tax=Hetaerina americana TaxID=62018 RepID=UPI003A7F5ECF